jgi:hypothetical protein
MGKRRMKSMGFQETKRTAVGRPPGRLLLAGHPSLVL